MQAEKWEGEKPFHFLTTEALTYGSSDCGS
jgi:hypothetical protein